MKPRSIRTCPSLRPPTRAPTDLAGTGSSRFFGFSVGGLAAGFPGPAAGGLAAGLSRLPMAGFSGGFAPFAGFLSAGLPRCGLFGSFGVAIVVARWSRKTLIGSRQVDCLSYGSILVVFILILVFVLVFILVIFILVLIEFAAFGLEDAGGQLGRPRRLQQHF